MTLTKEEDAELADTVRPCFAALALANDYFSFDKEWKEAEEPGASKPLNAVWFNMQWHGVDIAEAKRLVRDAANRYERRFLELCDSFRSAHAPISEKLDRYLKGMAYQVSGNVIWSLNCPRYHPEFRYDPNAGIEDRLTDWSYSQALPVQTVNEDEEPFDEGPPTALDHRNSIASTSSYFSESDVPSSSLSQASSRPSSISSLSDVSIKIMLPANERLGIEVSGCPRN
jgi:hypothetical protein